MAPKPIPTPIDSSLPLSPTRSLYLSHSKSQTYILDLTSQLPNIFSPSDDPALSLETAQNIATSTPTPPTIYTVKKENFLGTHFSVNDFEGKLVAEWKTLIMSLKMGTTRIRFLDREGGSAHRSYNIELKSVGLGRRAEIVSTSEESTPEKKIEIARFASKAPYAKDGVLVFDDRELDELATVLTLCAMMETKDSFTK